MSISLRRLADGLPASTEELLKFLDEIILPPQDIIARLPGEQGRIGLAYEAGKRALVDDLKTIWARQKRDQQS